MLLLLRANRWWGALLGDDGQLVGANLDLWRAVDQHPGYATTLAWVETQGVAAAERPREAKVLLTQSLLPDVIHAASGIERAVEMLRRHTAETQSWVDEYLRPKYERPEVGSRVHASDVLNASLALSEVVLWTRMLLDRIQRKDRFDGSYLVGLLPALADGPVRERVLAAHKALSDRVDGVRQLANYTAHHSGLPFPGAPADIAEDWTVSLRVPNVPAREVYPPELLTFHDWPTADAYSRALFSAVAEFVDQTLAAFRGEPAA